MDTDASVAGGRVGERLGQAEVQDVPVVVMQMDLEVQGGRIGLVPPKQPRKGLRSQITLGEEVL